MPRARLTRRDFLQIGSRSAIFLAGAPALLSSYLAAQTNSDQVEAVLKNPIQTADVVEFQLRQYLMKRVPPLPTPRTAGDWDVEQKRLRHKLLNEVIFHGWPTEWVTAAPRFEDVGVTQSSKGYRTRKLRYEIVPGFWSTALLYEPEKIKGKVPATLNLNGHTPQGKAAEYKQKRCINNALQGMYALSLEWLGMGELGSQENAHWMGAHLNLVGACATGLFYLAIRKGLDYLCQHPNIDTHRIGVTGLSGGALQTILLSSLDERVAVAIPISGYFAFISGIERNSDIGDIEYNPPDFRAYSDYTFFTAMRAPRPTLLIYGAEDEYGIRSAMAKPHLYDEIRPFFRLYGKEDAFAWHENVDPGTHNYQLDNRQQSYAFFSKHFGMPIVDTEIPVDEEIKSVEELAVGLPKDNLTILSLARKFARELQRAPVPAEATSRGRWATSGRARLNTLVRYQPVSVKHAWLTSSSRNHGLETLSCRLELSNELSATAVWLKATTAPASAPIVVILNDDGMHHVRKEVFSEVARCPIRSECRANSVAWHINRGEQVLAINVLFTGDASPDKLDDPKGLWNPATLYTELLVSIGERPLGIQAAQLVAATKWLQQEKGSPQVFLESTGMRSQVTALVACAIEPKLYSELLLREGIDSLGQLLEKPITYQDAPDLFCPDLYREFDIAELAALVEPTKVTQAWKAS